MTVGSQSFSWFQSDFLAERRDYTFSCVPSSIKDGHRDPTQTRSRRAVHVSGCLEITTKPKARLVSLLVPLKG